MPCRRDQRDRHPGRAGLLNDRGFLFRRPAPPLNRRDHLNVLDLPRHRYRHTPGSQPGLAALPNVIGGPARTSLVCVDPPVVRGENVRSRHRQRAPRAGFWAGSNSSITQATTTSPTSICGKPSVGTTICPTPTPAACTDLDQIRVSQGTGLRVRWSGPRPNAAQQTARRQMLPRTRLRPGTGE
jgi:hypothetical protein